MNTRILVVPIGVCFLVMLSFGSMMIDQAPVVGVIFLGLAAIAFALTAAVFIRPIKLDNCHDYRNPH